MFKVTTLDINNPPEKKTERWIFSKDFFDRETNLTVSGQLEGETYSMAFRIYTLSGRLSERRTPIRQGMRRNFGWWSRK